MKHKIASKAIVLSVLLMLIFSTAGATPTQAAGLYTHTWFVEQTIADLRNYDITNPNVDYSELLDILDRYPADVNYGSIYPDITVMKITVFIDLVEIDADWAERIHDTAGVKTNNYTKYLHFLAARYPDDLSSRNIDRQTSHYKEFLDDPNYTAAVPQFRAALMKVLLPYFKNSPRSVQDEKMIAFLFGLIAHQEGDAPWHWGYCDTDWKGLECALPYKVWPIKWNEIDLDNVLAHYDINGPDGENTVDFDFYPSTKPIILAAADAIGQLPECHMLG